jgi:hypothetical protein
MKRAKIVIPIVFLIVFALYFAASPFIALYQIKKAAENKNVQKISENIDFAALRKSIKDQLSAELNKQNVDADNSKKALKEKINSEVIKTIDMVINQTVKPETVIMLFDKNLKIPNQKEQQIQPIAEEKNDSDLEMFKNAKFKFDSLNQFSVLVKTDKSSKQELKLILTRKNLSWKINDIKMPLSLL